jgi:hypothetical protein
MTVQAAQTVLDMADMEYLFGTTTSTSPFI